MIPDFDESGHLPVGRYSCAPDEAKAFLVEQSIFSSSTTRAPHWENIERFLGYYFSIEEQLSDFLGDPLLDRFWLGGSFASSKVNPRNVDLTLFFHQTSREALRGKIGASKLLPSRDKTVRDYGISAIFLAYRRVPSVFRTDLFSLDDKDYFIDRGRWDDWWQRLRIEQSDDDGAPSVESCHPRRGYLEVIL